MSDKPLLKAVEWIAGRIDCAMELSRSPLCGEGAKAVAKDVARAHRLDLTKICEAVKEMRGGLETAIGMGEYSESGPTKTPKYRQEFWKGKREGWQWSLDELPTREELDALTKED